MEYIIMIFTLSLFIILAFLTGYNILYAARTAGVNRQLGVDLPPIIKRLFTATLIISLTATLISFALFLGSLLSQ